MVKYNPSGALDFKIKRATHYILRETKLEPPWIHATFHEVLKILCFVNNGHLAQAVIMGPAPPAGPDLDHKPQIRIHIPARSWLDLFLHKKERSSHQLVHY